MPVEDEFQVGIDLGDGEERAVGMILRVDGEQIGVVQEFTISQRDSQRVREMTGSKSFMIPAKQVHQLKLKNIHFDYPAMAFLYGSARFVRNPPPAYLRWWWVHMLGHANRSFKRTALSTIRRRWRSEAWIPGHKEDPQIERSFPMRRRDYWDELFSWARR